jgi:hypothetical protein
MTRLHKDGDALGDGGDAAGDSGDQGCSPLILGMALDLGHVSQHGVELR